MCHRTVGPGINLWASSISCIPDRPSLTAFEDDRSCRGPHGLYRQLQGSIFQIQRHLGRGSSARNFSRFPVATSARLFPEAHCAVPPVGQAVLGYVRRPADWAWEPAGAGSCVPRASAAAPAWLHLLTDYGLSDEIKPFLSK